MEPRSFAVKAPFVMCLRTLPNVVLAVLAVLAVVAIGAIRSPAAAFGNDDRASVTAMLTQSADHWNHGNLDAFMQTYENSPDTVYISAKGIVRGYAAIRAHYASHYKRGMGVLSFSDLALHSLGRDYEAITAHYHLAMRDGTHPTGPFSLILHRTGDGWRIVEDCSP